MKKLDAFSEIDSDVSRGQNVSRTWSEEQAMKQQKAMNMIDLVEQKMNGGIKPMDEQFPGEQEGVSPKDLFENDIMRDKYNTMATLNRLASGDVDESKWNESKKKSVEEYGKIKWPFVNWFYDRIKKESAKKKNVSAGVRG